MLEVSDPGTLPATSMVQERSEGLRIGRILSMVDLFAGCGGLSTGFEQAGFTPVFVSEINDDARKTYLSNRHHELDGIKFRDRPELQCADANELTDERIEKLKHDLSELNLGIRFEGDQTKEAQGQGGTLDLVAGGPPCQGFSGIGIRRSYAVDRVQIPSNRLYMRMAFVISQMRPKIFLFENVRGLLNAKWTREGGEKVWLDVLGTFMAIDGYTVRWSLVHASDYGVPQNRPRVLLVGIRHDVLRSASERLDDLDPAINPDSLEDSAVDCGFLPRGGESRPPDLCDLLGDLVDPEIGQLLDNVRVNGKYPSHFKTEEYPLQDEKGNALELTDVQKRFRSSPGSKQPRWGSVSDHEYSKHRKDIVEKFQYMLDHNGEIPKAMRTRKFSQRVLKKQWGNQRPNITATSLPDDYVHFSQPRTLTVREWARLQLFPDWYEFHGKRTTGGLRRAGNPREGNFDREVPKYTQIGNAVPVGLAEKVGKRFKEILDAAT
ncbi:DNA cytosine methyltransferase [Minwuia thermotolerans]|uniref:DNA cytosine methyltransferase n=1 Tax=Minwuia thermotolerans TaxID=2056226 RepID=UPI0019CFDD04|nr:DNA cytosine methyltransferase [Minwuia thermotolerans]